jgi:hypothetical protein
MDDFFFGVGDFDDPGAGEGAKIVGLAARGGIKGGAVENHFPALAFLLTGEYLRVKFAEEGIVVVETLGHRLAVVKRSGRFTLLLLLCDSLSNAVRLEG